MFPDLLEKKICSTLLAARNRWSFLDLGVILHTAAGRPAQLPAAAPAARAASGSCKNGFIRLGRNFWRFWGFSLLGVHALLDTSGF